MSPVKAEGTISYLPGIKFNSLLLPPYLKRSRSVEELLPWLYLKGVSTGDFAEALGALLGAEAKGLSASTISRLKAQWMFKLVQSAQKRWLRIRGFNHLGAVIEGVRFQDGVRVDQHPDLLESKDAA